MHLVVISRRRGWALHRGLLHRRHHLDRRRDGLPSATITLLAPRLRGFVWLPIDVSCFCPVRCFRNLSLYSHRLLDDGDWRLRRHVPRCVPDARRLVGDWHHEHVEVDGLADALSTIAESDLKDGRPSRRDPVQRLAARLAVRWKGRRVVHADCVRAAGEWHTKERQGELVGARDVWCP